jgi:glycosyltransferase involved in cell wall biosynthesis
MARRPFVSCLCPTFRRPRLLANALACFLAQDYPASRRELVILDDGGDFASHSGDGWRLVAVAERLPSLPAKYNTLAELAAGDVLVVWEDDDVYLPWHITAHAASLAEGGFSKPSRVLANFDGPFVEIDPGVSYHGSIAFTRTAFEAAGKWPPTRRASFDVDFMAALRDAAPMVDPCRSHPPSYAFRWGSTGAYHGQGLMFSADNETWYGQIASLAPAPSTPVGRLAPQMDRETAALFAAVDA